MGKLWYIRHETGDLSEYDSTVTDGGDLSVTAAAALAGSGYGLNCFIDDTTAIRGQKNQTDTTTGKLRFRFYIDPNGLTMANGDDFYVGGVVLSGFPSWLVIVRFYYTTADGYQLRLQVLNDAGATVFFDTEEITDAPHYVEIYIEQAATDVSADGTAEWWIDGVSKGSVSSIDNFDIFADMQSVLIGAIALLDAGTSGTFYLDEIVANDDGAEIGAVTYGDLWNITHDDGTLNEYDSTVTDGGKLSASLDSRMAGTEYGMQALIDDTTAKYGVKNQVDPTTGKLRIRLYIDPNTMTMADTDLFVAQYWKSTAPTASSLYLYMYYTTAAGYQLLMQIIDDANAVEQQWAIAITDEAHYVEMYMVQAATSASADGTFEWWIDGVSKGTNAGYDNFDTFAGLTDIVIGPSVGLDAGTSGTLYIDEINANNNGTEIGSALDNKAWYFDVDWDDDSVYDANEASRMVDFKSDRGRKTFISSGARGLQPSGLGKATVILDNYDGRYDPFTTDSPLSPNVEPGKYCRIQVTDGSNNYDVISGQIQDIQPRGGVKNPHVVVTINDGWRWMMERDSTTPLYEDIEADDAIGHILDDIDWPAIWARTLGEGIEEIPYWWGTGQKSHRQIIDTADSGLGLFWIGADGQARYKNRQTIEASLYSITQSDILAEIGVPQPWDVVRNIVEVVCNPRYIPTTDAVIWTSLDKFTIGPWETRTVWGKYVYNGEQLPAINVIEPLPTTDYVANTNIDGSGTDFTSDISTTDTEIFGDIAKIVYKNNGASGGNMIHAQIRGDPISSSDKIKAVGQDGAYATFPRTLQIDMEWLQNVNTAQDFADFLSSSLSEPQPIPKIRYQDSFDKQFEPDIFDVITASIAKYGISSVEYRVGGISHKWLTATGQDVRTEFSLEKYNDPTQYWIFTTQIGVTSIPGW